MCSCHQIRRYHQVSKRLSSDRPSWSKLCTVMHGQQGIFVGIVRVPCTFRAMRFSLLAAIIASLVNSFLSRFTTIFFMCHKNHPFFYVPQKSPMNRCKDLSNNNLYLLIIAHFISGYGVVDEENHLHFLEICAGSHRLTDCALDLGLKAHAMDDPCLHYLECMVIFES